MQTAKAPGGPQEFPPLPRIREATNWGQKSDSDTSPVSCQAPTIRAGEKGLRVAGEGDSHCAHEDSARGRSLTEFTAATPFSILSLNLQTPPQMPGTSSGLALFLKLPSLT